MAKVGKNRFPVFSMLASRGPDCYLCKTHADGRCVRMNPNTAACTPNIGEGRGLFPLLSNRVHHPEQELDVTKLAL